MLALSGLATARDGTLARGPGSLSGVWFNDAYVHDSVYDPRLQVFVDNQGKWPPLRPWARTLLEQRIASAEAGHAFANTKSQCLPSGVPQMMFGPALPIQFLESPGQVTILNEETAYFRIIRLDVPHKRDPDPSFLGDSVGHWVGDTLVVDTIGLSEKTTFDVVGMPHTAALHVVERFRRTGPDRIDLTVRFDDPGTFTRQWSARTHFKHPAPDRRIEEYLCENNRDVPHDGITRPQLPSGADGTLPRAPDRDSNARP